MNSVDGVILGIGAIVLVASIMGVVFYEDDASQSFTVSWGEGEERSLDEVTDSVGSGEQTYEVDVDGQVIHTVTFSVTVNAQDSTVSEDSVSVTVAGPQDQSGDCSFAIASTDNQGSCDAEVEVNDEPDLSQIEAADTDAAEEQALQEAASDEGNGTWEVTITIDEGTEVQTPSYDISIQPTVTEWDPLAERPGIDTPR